MAAARPRKGLSPPRCFSSPEPFPARPRTPGLQGKGLPCPPRKGRSRRLPANPSQENLRKQAKRLAKAEGLRLAAAQRRLANELRPSHLGRADARRRQHRAPPAAALSPLSVAAARADEAEVRALLAHGEPADGPQRRGQHAAVACLRERRAGRSADRRCPAAAGCRRVAAAQCEDSATPLHAAARRGPLALVELLIRARRPSWQADRHGKTALDYARAGRGAETASIVELLDRPVIRDPHFRAAVAAIHAATSTAWRGCSTSIRICCTMRAIEPDCYPQGLLPRPQAVLVHRQQSDR